MKEMNIYPVMTDKKQHLELLLLADEQESMIDRYLERGDMFVVEDDGVKAVCVVTDEGNGICELKNIAVTLAAQRQGYGKKLINYLIDHYSGKYIEMLVGTGDVPSAMKFYQSCGFEYSHRIENFFIDNYDHLMVEEGVLLKDMVYLKRMMTERPNKIQRYQGRIPACGVFCGGCPTYTREKSPCKGAELNSSRCEKCKTFHLCCLGKEITHCFQCSSFPCTKFKGFTKRWLKYGQNFIENQKLLSEIGEVAFLKYYNKKITD